MTLGPSTTRRAGLACLRLAYIWLACIWLGATFGVGASVADTVDNEPRAFTQTAFEAAQHAGKPILVETYATWCAVCARQVEALKTLRAEAKYRDLVTFKVNFDTQTDTMRKFNARMQSTLIAFRGTDEVGRSVGETQGEWIDDMLQKTLR